MVRNYKNKTSDNPWLSIVIPIYNSDRYLDECLKSITAQTFNNYEVILVDDGSSDNSSDICKKISQTENRFKYYRIENGGVVRARLYGIDKTRGKYITFCDADDYYANKRAFEILYYKASEIKEPFSFIQFSFYRKFNHLGKRVRCVGRDTYINSDRFYFDEYPQLLCNNWKGAHLNSYVWNKIYDRNLIDNILSIDVERRLFWGEDLVINMFMLQTIVGAYYLPDSLYVYREFTGGTCKFSMTTMEDLNVIKSFQLAFLAQKGHSDADKILKCLYAEIAAWSAFYIKEAADYLDKRQLELHINNMLKLPMFIKAREYYSNHPEAWDEAEMIKRGQVGEYMEYAEREKKVDLKKRLLKKLKRVYKSI